MTRPWPAWRVVAGAVLAAMGPAIAATHAQAQELPSSVFEAQNLLRRPGIVDPLLTPIDPQANRVGIPFGGGFILIPTVEIGAQGNSNVFVTDHGKADNAAAVAPDIRLRTREAGPLRLNAYLHGNFLGYADSPTENVAELFGGVDLGLQVAPNTAVRARVEGGRFVQDRGTGFEVTNNRSPLKFERFTGSLGLTATPGRLIVSPTLELDRIAAHDNEVQGQPGVVLPAQQRSYVRTSPQMLVGYAVSPITAVYVGGEVNRRDYDIARVPSRDSRGYVVYGGVRFRPSPLTRLDVAFGYIRQDYAAPLTSPSAPYVRASFLWAPTRLTRVRADVRRDVSETGGLAIGGALRTRYQVDVEHDLMRDTRIEGGAELRHYRFSAIDRTDDRFGVTGGLNRTINRRFDLFVRGEQLFSKTTGGFGLDYDFARTRVTAGLRLKA